MCNYKYIIVNIEECLYPFFLPWSSINFSIMTCEIEFLVLLSNDLVPNVLRKSTN